MNDPRLLPRILLVEDEPTSAAFLAAAAQAVPARVDVAGDMRTALSMADAQIYELWLFDATLPDGSGGELLSRLRERFPHVPAIAHTASDDSAQLGELVRLGFREVLKKPLPAAQVRAAVRRGLGLPAIVSAESSGFEALPLWDDQSAARALNGNEAHVSTLRGLFVAELPQACQRIRDASLSGDVDGVGSELHRLRASCGFVGAAKLDAIVQALQQDQSNPRLLARFDEAATITLAQLPSIGCTSR